jgi:hypothetical protein
LPVDTRPSAILLKHLVVPTTPSLDNALPAIEPLFQKMLEKRVHRKKKKLEVGYFHDFHDRPK